MGVESTLALVGGLDRAQWTPAQPWLAAVGVGGALSGSDVDAIIGRRRHATRTEHDVLAASLNDHLDAADRVPYWSELAAG
jgi:hypothetical protein